MVVAKGRAQTCAFFPFLKKKNPYEFCDLLQPDQKVKKTVTPLFDLQYNSKVSLT